MRFLNSKYAKVLTLVLLAQAAAYYALASRPELLPPSLPLALFPQTAGDWQTYRDRPIDPQVLDVLKSDDTLDRIYVNTAQTEAIYLFIAFFKSQRSGQTPHSPKNCLPGSGWEPIEAGFQTIAIAGREAPIVSNRYVVRHGDEKSVVLYWYQSHNRAIASEYSAKMWLVADAIRYRRSDTALVKVVVPVRGNDIEGAVRTGTGFIQTIYPQLLKQLPA